MIISAIVAVSNNGVIGIDNDLPWHMPADLKFFKETTLGHHVLMGRKSFDSIGRPLPGRTNIILTRNKDFHHSGVITVRSIVDGILVAQNDGIEELFILGGANVYEQTMGLWNKLYLTRIDTSIDKGTAFFPDVDYGQWNLIKEDKHVADEKNPFNCTFCTFHKKHGL